ncbi:hypothetical protein M3J09_011225 [Ascochyta lentis]
MGAFRDELRKVVVQSKDWHCSFANWSFLNEDVFDGV